MPTCCCKLNGCAVCKRVWIIRDQNNIARLKYFDYTTSYYTDVYEFNTDPNNQNIPINSASASILIKINTVDINIGNNIVIGDTIEIYNSIYLNIDRIKDWFIWSLHENQFLDTRIFNNRKEAELEAIKQSFELLEEKLKPIEFEKLEE